MTNINNSIYEIKKKYLTVKLPPNNSFTDEVIHVESHWANANEKIVIKSYLHNGVNYFHILENKKGSKQITEIDMRSIHRFFTSNPHYNTVIKTRRIIEGDTGHRWNIDEYYNLSLTIAEISSFTPNKDDVKKLREEQNNLKIPTIIDHYKLLDITDKQQFNEFNLSSLT